MKKNRKKAIIIEILLVLAVAAVVVAVVIGVGSTEETPETAGSETPANTGESAAAGIGETEQTATYMIKYDATWSAETHPETLPEGAHVSPIFVVAHANEGDLFAAGTAATEGIEIMAETGATAVLADEVGANPSILDSTVGSLINVPGSIELEIELDQDHPLLSAVSMLAPSPDWFVAVSNVELFRDGQWLEEVSLAVRPYDSGTDSGATFTADDLETDPAGVIGSPADDSFTDAAAENRFATITLTKKKPG
ncbi:hypothetical protein F4X86_01035 [Candidatus Saccharibacteria bacterium]|nr:hypothetical protein [Candidatus Saccharibacteria bacterium]